MKYVSVPLRFVRYGMYALISNVRDSCSPYVSKQKRGLFNEIGFLWGDNIGEGNTNVFRGDLYNVL